MGVQGQYKAIPINQTNALCGNTGASGDYLDRLIVIPTSTSPGGISIKDGGNPTIAAFAGGSSSLSNLTPFTITLGLTAQSATTPGWRVTTGAGLTVIAVGNFT